jgi:ankyrin repeat protein
MAAINLSQYGIDFVFDPTKDINAIPEDFASRVSKISVTGNIYTFTSLKGFKNVYTLGNEIGAGSFGNVYECRREGNITPMVIKIKSDIDVMNLIKESLIQIIVYNTSLSYKSKGVSGPFTPQLFDVGYNPKTNTYCIVSEYLQDTVRHVLQDTAIVDIEKADMFILNVLSQVCIMLSFLFTTLKFNHRDLKTDNIMVNLSKTGTVKVYLIDFGYSCLHYGNLIIEGNDAEFAVCSNESRDLIQLLYEINFNTKIKQFYFSERFRNLLADLLQVPNGDEICVLEEGCKGLKEWKNTYKFLNVEYSSPNCTPEVVLDILKLYIDGQKYKDYLPFSKKRIYDFMNSLFSRIKQAESNNDLIPNINGSILELVKNKYIDLMYLKLNPDGTYRPLTSTYKQALLILAANYGLNRVVDILLKEGAEINKGFSGDDNFVSGTALNLAVKNNHVSTINFLIDEGADLNKIDSRRNYPLLTAIEGRNLEVIQILLRAGADINYKSGLISPLMKVAEMGAVEILDLFDKRKLKINLAISGSTALYVACSKNRTEIIEKLLQMGADINISNPFHGSPLMIAIKNQHYDVAYRLLSEKSINVERVDEDKNTALILAAQSNNERLVDLLLKAGANKNVANSEGFLPSDVTTSDKILTLLSSRGGFTRRVYKKNKTRKNHLKRSNVY